LLRKLNKNKTLYWLLLFFVFLWHKPLLKIYFVLDYREAILVYSEINDLSPVLISSIVFAESRFNSAARSSKGALGLMQIMPSTGRWVANQIPIENFSRNDLLEPEKNLKIGAWYLAYLHRYFKGNQTMALAAYNAGHGYVEKWLETRIWDGDPVKIEKIPFPETKKYLFRINLLQKIYKYLYPEIGTNISKIQ